MGGEETNCRARPIKENAPGIGQFDPARLTAKELNVKLGFDRLDPLAKRRLLHAEPLGSPRDVTSSATATN